MMIYDITGVHLTDIQPGTGIDDYLYFTLSSLDGIRGDLYIYLIGRAEYQNSDYSVNGLFQLSIKKVSLP
jgi:hypothetical protein